MTFEPYVKLPIERTRLCRTVGEGCLESDLLRSTADIDLATAEATIISPVNQRLLKIYTEAREHLGRAAKVPTP